jgi:hypothetical protein
MHTSAATTVELLNMRPSQGKPLLDGGVIQQLGFSPGARKERQNDETKEDSGENEDARPHLHEPGRNEHVDRAHRARTRNYSEVETDDQR